MNIDTDEVIAIPRPADGNYRFDTEESRDRLHRSWVAIFGKDYYLSDGLYARVVEAAWANSGSAHHLGFVTEIDGWTRPMTHILLDMVEFTNRLPLAGSMTALRALLGRDLAAEFVSAVAKAHVFFAHPSPETIAEAERQDIGFKRVGPRPERIRFTREELKILNTLMTDRGGWPAVDDLVRKLAEAAS